MQTKTVGKLLIHVQYQIHTHTHTANLVKAHVLKDWGILVESEVLQPLSEAVEFGGCARDV